MSVLFTLQKYRKFWVEASIDSHYRDADADFATQDFVEAKGVQLVGANFMLVTADAKSSLENVAYALCLLDLLEVC